MWNLSGIERWRESIESFCLYGFELRDIDGTLIRCDLQSRKHWGQVTTAVPSLVTFEACLSPGFYIFEGIENESAAEELLLKHAS